MVEQKEGDYEEYITSKTYSIKIKNVNKIDQVSKEEQLNKSKVVNKMIEKY